MIKSYFHKSELIEKHEFFKEKFERRRESFTSGFATARFCYDPKTKTIFEYIDVDSYRSITHSDILEHFGLTKNEVYRLEFNQEKCYDGTYMCEEFGIPGLCFSDIYHSCNKLIELLPVLSKQDLDIIENYINKLKAELRKENQ